MHRHRTTRSISSGLRNRRDGFEYRRRQQAERDDVFDVKDFRLRRRWHRHNDEMAKMLEGVSW